MKLAEALSLRKDLQKKIDQLGSRLTQNVKVQEGDEPAERPEDLLGELDGCLRQLEELVLRINVTNLQAERGGRTLTAMIAERDMLIKHISILRDTFDKASQGHDRYSRSEIKYVSTIDIKALGRQIDHYSQELRKLDMQIQAANFEVDLA